MTHPSTRPATVVVVEDEAMVRELALGELEDGGFTVVGFPTADAALVHLRDHADETSVVFTDVQMPGRLNGLDLTAIIARSWPSIRVLVTSGGAVVRPTLLPPCARFLPKPWRAAEVVGQVARLAKGAAALSGRPLAG